MDTLKLDQNVNQLTRETTHRLDTEDGSMWAKADSLLDQLRDAVEPSMGGGGKKRQSSILPLNPDAVDLLDDIDLTARAHAAEYRIHRDGLEETIQGWAAASRGYGQDHIDTAQQMTAGWIGAIQGLFDPPKRQQVKAHCPECGRRHQYRVEAGETVRQAAIQVTVLEGKQSYAECGVCGTQWPQGAMWLLAAVIEEAA